MTLTNRIRELIDGLLGNNPKTTSYSDPIIAEDSKINQGQLVKPRKDSGQDAKHSIISPSSKFELAQQSKVDSSSSSQARPNNAETQARLDKLRKIINSD